MQETKNTKYVMTFGWNISSTWKLDIVVGIAYKIKTYVKDEK